MADCNVCHSRLTVTRSAFPGFDLLQCETCARPIKLLVLNGQRLNTGPAPKRGDLNRALRAHRRKQAKS